MHRTAWVRIVMLMAGLLAAAGLAHTAGAATAQATAAMSEQLVTIEKALTGPYIGRAFVVANSAADWTAAMSALGSAHALETNLGPPAPANVDWNTEAVILIAAGSGGGYDVTLELTPAGGNQVSLGALWTPLGNEGAWAYPYDLVHTVKRGWLTTQVVIGDAAAAALPISGLEDVPAAAVLSSWGGVKALYR